MKHLTDPNYLLYRAKTEYADTLAELPEFALAVEEEVEKRTRNMRAEIRSQILQRLCEHPEHLRRPWCYSEGGLCTFCNEEL